MKKLKHRAVLIKAQDARLLRWEIGPLSLSGDPFLRVEFTSWLKGWMPFRIWRS